ncbi:lactosylceramide 1,3-N-acetyl-beta-D-glucosaminyltransferase A-like [Gymnodraco acuticeps]|uniref:Hexosyltransferase n=1 Tax=Gymnodraco acuticeps TaxID=8218 RepID=A0A6P8UL60_GYMAC|nr:lactosylceramide 1,3-N-acetyl-beta-D-glucosaminyltransferase A-like [Gymnodraco acuticeps]XP_034072653.1 lactosylceramide 1,3-N-acetyl-beta-D-glucosaminyltransferase A-like [Gymnodraco acuticeps]XP_034072654.1 lactosylceramide 1,3-N-acetyl-beta-D-glucosaminyltransferase A-like [Gymnodraco acuticeps]XP_034072655.1 lactosylceramide 1,3-N-acetyl-beta-D-glucosaminyltransferase A-like [Gymnodraco acuticeps]
MFMNFRRIHKCQFVQLLTACMGLCVVMVSWEELDHHVVSHMRSYTYRYLVNSYDFLNSNFNITSNRHRKDGSTNVLLTYPYLINHPGKCARGDGKSGDDVLLLLFVKSSPENFERRQAIRDTWGNESFVWSELGATMRMVFALGVDTKQRSRVQRALLQEDQTYGDLIQQDFLDTFHNLTAKLITQFHWVHDYCPQARFLMSADDDIFVHMPNLVKYLRQLLRNKSGVKDFWVGHVHRGAPPVRRKESKYHIPYDLYPWPSYPDYTAGAGYVVSGDVAAKIYQATQVLNSSIYIDDVFMGICAKAMGVSPQEHVYFSGEGKALYHPCIYDHMITSHGHATDVRSLWQAATDPAVYGKSRGFMGNLYCTAVRAMMLCRPYYQNSYSCKAAFT